MKENLEIIASWWCDQITTTAPNWNNGDDSPNGGMAFLLGNLLAGKSRDEMPSDAPKKFKAIFVKEALEYYKENGYLPDMSVDYHPSVFLAEVAKEAGISPSAFPCKSYSTIRNEKPYAKCGYGKDLQELFAVVA